MHVFIRVLLLGVFSATGVALATSIALRPDRAELSSYPVAPEVDLSTVEIQIAEQPGIPDLDRASLEPVAGPVATSSLRDAHAEVAQNQDMPLLEPSRVSRQGTLPYPTIRQPPVLAPYASMVADPLETFQVVLDRLAEGQRETQAQLEQLRSELPEPDVAPQPRQPSPQLNAQTTGPETEPTVEVDESSNLTIELEDSPIREVLRLLSEAAGVNILATPGVGGTVTASLSEVDVETALDAILRSSGLVAHRDGDFIFVGNSAELRGMIRASETLETRVYRPNYVTTTELQTLITPILTEGIGTVAISSAAETGIGTNSTDAGGDAFAGEGVVLVRDYESVLAEIDSVMTEVDIMPLQVSIEATILSVRLDDSNELGVDFELLRQKDSIRIVSGTPLTSLVTAPFQDGLKIGFLDASVLMFLNALETIGDTHVIASPRVMCLNKQRAEILIGAELGYVSTTVTETAATQTVEFLEVGTNLRLRPFISTDGMIRMEVHPELSQGSVKVQQGFTLPDKEVTQVTTNIMCRTGATIVIGGLIQEDLITNSTQIPVLGNLPIVGTVFRQRVEDIERREIIVLLTPRIIGVPEAEAEGAEFAGQTRNRRNSVIDKMTPIGKRYYARRYLRLASAAWNIGDLDAALRYANLAIHFDPLNQGAVNLREEIVAAAPDLERGIDARLRPGLFPGGHPHRDYSRDGVPWDLPDSQEFTTGSELPSTGNLRLEEVPAGNNPVRVMDEE